jgi:hypothetical protein
MFTGNSAKWASWMVKAYGNIRNGKGSISGLRCFLSSKHSSITWMRLTKRFYLEDGFVNPGINWKKNI